MVDSESRKSEDDKDLIDHLGDRIQTKHGKITLVEEEEEEMEKEGRAAQDGLEWHHPTRNACSSSLGKESPVSRVFSQVDVSVGVFVCCFGCMLIFQH